MNDSRLSVIWTDFTPRIFEINCCFKVTSPRSLPRHKRHFAATDGDFMREALRQPAFEVGPKREAQERFGSGRQTATLFSIPATLARVIEEFPGTKSFFLKYDRERFAYRASQVVRLSVLTSEGNQLHHPFSIASSPTEESLLIATRIRHQSEFKNTLERMKVGDTLAIAGTDGRFVFPEDSDHPIVMIAGGESASPRFEA